MTLICDGCSTVLAARNPELGRMLLLSPVEVFGEAHARMGRKLSLLFRLTGLPYLSGTMKTLSQSFTRMMSGRRRESRQSDAAKKAIADWAATNGRQAPDRIVAALLETVRRNASMRDLANSERPVDPILVARTLRDYGALDWTAGEDLLRLFEPFSRAECFEEADQQLHAKFHGALGDIPRFLSVALSTSSMRRR